VAVFTRLSAWLTILPRCTLGPTTTSHRVPLRLAGADASAARNCCGSPPARYSVRSPWPREALQFVDAVERGSRWVRAARRRVSGAYGLSVAQWRLLKALRQENDSSRGPSVAQLARRLA
jgi:hypothetical protein